MRSYVAVGGGFDVEPVLGSRSTDTLAWVGPARVDGRHGAEVRRQRASRCRWTSRDCRGRARCGSTRDRTRTSSTTDALEAVCAAAYDVRPESNRVGLRLRGPEVPRRGPAELPSEGMVLGAVQVPPDGQPVVLLADHPPTGGYPVVGVVHPDDLWQCGQLRPGEPVRFTPVRAA